MSTKDIALGRFATMPQAGGSPIVESGSNSDGEWTRWADGTQECRQETVHTGAWAAWGPSAYTISGPTVTFPSPFVSIPVTSGADYGSKFVIVATGNPTTTGCSYAHIYGATAASTTRSVMITATGRWK